MFLLSIGARIRTCHMSVSCCLLLLLPLLVLASTTLVEAKKEPWRTELRQRLDSTYTLTKLSSLGTDRIARPGTVLVTQTRGLSADPTSTVTTLPNEIRDGVIKQAGVFGKKKTRTLDVGERLYVTDLAVRQNMVALDLVTCDTFEVTEAGSTEQTRYKVRLYFMFDDLPTAEFEAIKSAIDGIAMPEDQAQAAQTKTIELGQSPEQVQSILGNPEKIIKLGEETVYMYADLKVIFIDGKVADVE